MDDSFEEPHRSQFAALIRAGAGTLDIQDGQTGRFAEEIQANDALIAREIDRVRVHEGSMCRLLEAAIGRQGRIIDVGCGTGATTVALARSPALAAEAVIGIDPNAFSIKAAEVRAAGYANVRGKIAFRTIEAGAALPVETDAYDLTVCVSVIEYMREPQYRDWFASELLRITRPGGYVFLATPNPFRPFDYHTHRLLGDWRRTEGYPWASTPGQIRRMFPGARVRFLRRSQLTHGLRMRGIRIPGVLTHLLTPLALVLPWQKVLVRKAAAAS